MYKQHRRNRNSVVIIFRLAGAQLMCEYGRGVTHRTKIIGKNTAREMIRYPEACT